MIAIECDCQNCNNLIVGSSLCIHRGGGGESSRSSKGGVRDHLTCRHIEIIFKMSVSRV